MKALTLKQPWATLLAAGTTRYNMRPWRTRHRGRLALFAGRHFDEDAVDLCLHEDMRPHLVRAGCAYLIELPLGSLVGTARLVDCVPARELTPQEIDPADPAIRFSGVFPGQWAWIFEHPERFARPVPWRGKLGIFSVPDALLEKAQAGTA